MVCRTSAQVDNQFQEMISFSEIENIFLETEFLDSEEDSDHKTNHGVSQNSPADLPCCSFLDITESEKDVNLEADHDTLNKNVSYVPLRTPSRRKSRKLNDGRASKCLHDEISTKKPMFQSTPPPPRISSGTDPYHAAFQNLASSMKKSELSRTIILNQGLDSSVESLKPSLSTIRRCGDLLTGKCTALTRDLEYSRLYLRRYLMLFNAPFER